MTSHFQRKREKWLFIELIQGSHVKAGELPDARRVAFGIVVGQAVLTVLVALLCHAFWGPWTGLSAAIGGGIGTLASLAMAVLGMRPATDVAGVARAFFVGEAAKLAVVVVLFVVVLTTMKKVLVPAALFGGYVATFVVYWVVLAKGLPAFGGRVPPKA